MAFIKKDQEDQQSSLNVLGSQGANQTQDMPSQSESGDLSQASAQGATIGQTGQQAQQQAPASSKRASSGMFSNIRKYIDRNKPGAQRIGQNITQRFEKRADDVGQAINKQKTDFMSRVEANRGRLGQAQQFGQQTVQTATQQESQPMLQQQATDLQERADRFAPMQDQGYLQNIQQTQQNIEQFQPEVESAQQSLQQAQQLQQQRQQELDNLQGNLYDRFNVGVGQQFTNQQGQLTQTKENDLDQYLNQQIENTLANNSFAGDPRSQLVSDYERYKSLQAQIPELTTDQQTQLDQKQIQAGNLENQLQEYRELDRMYNNKQQIENELAVLQDRMDNAPEQLTESDIERFNNLRTGKERFDQAILNLTQQSRETDILKRQAEDATTAQGRLALLREAFGKRGDYTRGESALDNLLISSDPQTRDNLLQSLASGSKDLSANLRESQRTGLVEQDRMRQEQEAFQQSLGEQVGTAQTALEESLQEKVQSGEGSYVKQLSDALASGGGLSAEQMDMLGLTGKEIFNVDPNTLLQQYDPSQYSIQDVADLTDVARAQALARLEGKDQQTLLANIDEIESRYQRGESDPATLTLEELSDSDRA